MKQFALGCFFLILICASVHAQENEYGLAVLDLQPNGVSETESRVLSDVLRSSILKVIQEQRSKVKGSYTLIERSQMDKILEEFEVQNTGCTDVSCAIEFGEMLNAERIIIGTVGLVGSTYIVVARIVDVETSTTLVSVDRTVPSPVDNVIKLMSAVGHELLTGERISVPLAQTHAAPSQLPVSGQSVPASRVPVKSPTAPDISGGSDIFGILMVPLPAGSFQMGDIQGSGSGDEKPVHTVTLSGFMMSATEVSVGQFRAFVEDTGYRTEAERGDGASIFTGEEWTKKRDANWKNPYMSQDDDHPVVCVSWNDANAFCQWLSEKTGEEFRLPTEAEWEYACRAGTETKYYTGNSEGDLGRAGWYSSNSGSITHTVGQKESNPWGLYDMHGNAWEWCNDWFGESYYSSSPSSNPTGPSSGSRRVDRGGGWGNSAGNCRSANRSGSYPTYTNGSLGFRVVRRP